MSLNCRELNCNNVLINDTLSVKYDANIKGLSIINGNVNVKGHNIILGNSNVNGNEIIYGSLNVNNDSDSKNLIINDNLNISNTLIINNATLNTLTVNKINIDPLITNKLTLQGGTRFSPSIAFKNSTDSGIYNQNIDGSGNIKISTNSLDRFTVNNNFIKNENDTMLKLSGPIVNNLFFLNTNYSPTESELINGPTHYFINNTNVIITLPSITNSSYIPFQIWFYVDTSRSATIKYQSTDLYVQTGKVTRRWIFCIYTNINSTPFILN